MDINGADLTGADLSFVKLESANLRHENLTCAILSEADLSYVNLEGTNVARVDLEGTNITVTVVQLPTGLSFQTDEPPETPQTATPPTASEGAPLPDPFRCEICPYRS